MFSNSPANPDDPRFIPQAERLMDRVREVLRYHHYSIRTEEAYVKWIAAFIRFNGRKHPENMGKSEIEAFLSDLAVNKKCAKSTQSQALNAIVFLYKKVLNKAVSDQLEPVRSKRPVRLPVVMSQTEVTQVLSNMSAAPWLMARVMYGSGLRMIETLRLRVKDLDFENGLIMVRSGKGDKDRSTVLPVSLYEDLHKQLEKSRIYYEEDLANGNANVFLPYALSKKYPNASSSWSWQWVFPSTKLSTDPRGGEIRRHHMVESSLQKSLSRAVKKCGITKRVTSHTFRHSFATHLLESGTNIRVVQKLLGHADVKTTEIYTHVLQQNLQKVVSPLDNL